jgi:hypothetical protein
VAHNVWRAVVIAVKGAGVLAVILGVLVFAAIIWFSINPPFASPKTGSLHATATRDLRLGAGQTTLAIRLEARLNDNAIRTSSGAPDPPNLRATLIPTETGTLDGLKVRLAPGDTGRPLTGVRKTGIGRFDWPMACPDGTGPGCRQWVILLVQTPPSASERHWRLNVDGDLRYPAFTPTPGWSSFDLDLRSLGAEDGSGAASAGATEGAVELTGDRPVVVVPVHLDLGAAPGLRAGASPAPGTNPPAGTLLLALDAARLTDTPPTGFDAPEPIRATVLAADGTVLARQGIRPGDGGRTLGLPIAACSAGCATDYRIAFEWMDRRPDADYRLTWRAEVMGLPAENRAGVSAALRTGDPEIVAPAGPPVALPEAGGSLRGQRFDLHIGGASGAGLPVAPVHIQLLVTATVDPSDEVGASATTIRPIPLLGGPGQNGPFDVLPGQSGSFVVNLEDSCKSALCDRWAMYAIHTPAPAASNSVAPEVSWKLEARAWRLVPDPAPISLSLEVQ